VTRLAIAALVLAVSSAHAEPLRLAPWRAVTETPLDHAKPKLQIDRAPRVDHGHGIDEALAEAIARATHFAGKVAGMRHGVGPFVHVENLVADVKGADAPPRVVVIGIQVGGALPVSR
jgi:hypothetical protein